MKSGARRRYWVSIPLPSANLRLATHRHLRSPTAPCHVRCETQSPPGLWSFPSSCWLSLEVQPLASNCGERPHWVALSSPPSLFQAGHEQNSLRYRQAGHFGRAGSSSGLGNTAAVPGAKQANASSSQRADGLQRKYWSTFRLARGSVVCPNCGHAKGSSRRCIGSPMANPRSLPAPSSSENPPRAASPPQPAREPSSPRSAAHFPGMRGPRTRVACPLAALEYGAPHLDCPRAGNNAAGPHPEHPAGLCPACLNV